MAQAVPNLTTRRGFSKWLAAMGAAVAVPVAVQAAQVSNGLTADWASFEAPLKAAAEKYRAAKARAEDASSAIDRWKKRFPWPEEPFYESRADRVADYTRRRAEENSHALRYQAALTQVGIGKLRRAENDAYDEAITICKRIADTPA